MLTYIEMAGSGANLLCDTHLELLSVEEEDSEVQFSTKIQMGVNKAVEQMAPIQPNDLTTKDANINESMRAIIREIARETLTEWQPMMSDIIKTILAPIVTEIASAIHSQAKTMIDAVKMECEKNLQKLKATVVCQRSDTDALEQYGRRESVRLFGMEETANDDTNEAFIQLAASIGVDISANDISVSHRIGKPRQGANARPRPIIAKFVRRDTKVQIMRSRKKLRENERFNRVHVEEDLTSLRHKIVMELKRDETAVRAWTIDGRMFCIQHEHGREVKEVINNPDDLLKLGWDENMLRHAGMSYDQ